MAANKFATMLNRNTNKLTLILVYAFLEWVLIVLLLLNSLFSYLILRFADFFGLKRPCLWCSRIDHVFDPAAKTEKSYRDLVCEDHAREIGVLGYCSNHRKLAESKRMCGDCSSSSRPSCGELDNIAYRPWVKRIGEVCENGEMGSVSECSCCGLSVDESKLYPPWEGFDYGHREEGLIVETGVEVGERVHQSDRSRSKFVADDPAGEDEEQEQLIGKDRGIEVNSGIEIDEGEVDVIVEKEQDLIKLDDDDNGDLSFSIYDLCFNQAMTRFDSTMDASPEIVHRHLEFFIGHDDYRLIPFELIDSGLAENQIQYTCEEADRDVVLNFDFEVDEQIEREANPIVEKSCTTEEKEPLLSPIHESEDESELVGVESRGLSELAEKVGSLEPEEGLEVVEKEEDEVIVAARVVGTPSVDCSDVQEIVREMNSDAQEIVREMDSDVQEIVREMDAGVHIVPKEEGLAVVKEEDELIVAAQVIETPLVDCSDVQEIVREMDADVQEIAREMDADVHIVSEEEEKVVVVKEEDELLVDAQTIEIPYDDCSDVQETLREMGADVQEIVREMDADVHIAFKEEEVEEEDKLIVAAQAIEIPSDDCSNVQEFVREMDADVQEFVREMDADAQESVREIDTDVHIAFKEEEAMIEKEEDELTATTQTIELPSADFSNIPEIAREMDADVHIVSEEEDDTEMHNGEMEADVSIGSEIPDHKLIDEYQSHEDCSYQTIREDPSTSHDGMLDADHDQGYKNVEFKTLSVETSPNPLFSQLSRSLELNDIEEDKFPDTPSSVDSLRQFNRRSFSLERRESGTESLDGSVISDIEPGEMTVEKLSSALKFERKALNALYAELDEERSASAVAASQTMAMINRLHEEKAAMQMEALQYQRMMEEQSEYDQEALQLLNELMVKREREKQELEKELEAYRRKVEDYEAREKMLMARRREAGIRSMTSSVSCSNAEDSDGSVDLSREAKEDDTHFSQDCENSHNTPIDAVLYLEEERASILEELKVLEEKLFTMNSEEEDHFEDVKTFETAHHNTNGVNVESNGKHHQATRTISKPKRLLPLFDAIELGAEDDKLNTNEHLFDSASQHDSSDSIFELETKRPAIEEEVDHVYERLQALEADREFLKHCMTSLKKGDKGVYLLQEILQHLRDLRNVDLRAKHMEDRGVI